MQMAMRAAPPTRVMRRLSLSARIQMKKVLAMTLTAPKRPVSSMLRFVPLPAMSLKYCGANTARALLPVAFWKMNNNGPTKKRKRLAGSRSSRMEKPSRSARSACSPNCVSVNSSRVLEPSPPRIQTMAFQASSVRFWVNSQRMDSGRVKVPRSRMPPEINCRPTGICHSREVPARDVFLATPWSTCELKSFSKDTEYSHSQPSMRRKHPRHTATGRKNRIGLESPWESSLPSTWESRHFDRPYPSLRRYAQHTKPQVTGC